MKMARKNMNELRNYCFLVLLMHIVNQNDIDLSREPNSGRGAVDFKLSRGATIKVLVENKTHIKQ